MISSSSKSEHIHRIVLMMPDTNLNVMMRIQCHDAAPYNVMMRIQCHDAAPYNVMMRIQCHDADTIVTMS